MNTKKCISDADLGRLGEGDVTPQQKEALHGHIEMCPHCRARWDQMIAGSRYIDSMVDKARKAQVQSTCLSDSVLTGFVDETLDPETWRMAEEHLAQCPQCGDALDAKFAELFPPKGNKWRAEFIGCEILALFARIPGEIDKLLELIGKVEEKTIGPDKIVKLPILKPSEGGTMRLAAATGEGLSEQRLHQDDPPFDFHLVQFGRQLRIGIRATGEELAYRNFLGRLELLDADTCKYSQVILIDRGEGQCVIEPEDVSRIQPREKQLAIKFVPVLTLADLTSAGSEVYKPIFAKLLEHKDPQIRRSTVEVVARVYGPGADSLIEPLAEDNDEAVCLAVQKALKRYPHQ